MLSGKALQISNLTTWVLSLGIVFQFAVGVLSPLSRFQREFWQDPLRHNDAAYGAQDFSEFKKKVARQSQPLLEYAFRRYLFFPVFGFSERSMRLPDWIFWILSLVVAAWFTYFVLGDRGIGEKNLKLLGVLGVLWWLSTNPILVEYASEGRHYAWCAFFSFVWTYTVIREDSLPSWTFHLASFFYLNSHFFVWPLVGAFYLFRCFKIGRTRGWKAGFPDAFWGLLILACSLAVNYTSAKHLWMSPPTYSKSLPPPSPSVVIERTWGTVLLFLKTFQLESIILISIAFSLWKKQKKELGLVFITLGIFLLMRWKSDYRISERYFLPFIGLAWIMYLSFLNVTLLLLRICTKKTSAVYFFLIGLTIYQIYYQYPLLVQVKNIDFSEANFSKMYRLFREFEEATTPTVILSVAKSETATLDFYQENLRTNGQFIEVFRFNFSKPLESLNLFFTKFAGMQRLLYGPTNPKPCSRTVLELPVIWSGFWGRCLLSLPEKMPEQDLVEKIKQIVEGVP